MASALARQHIAYDTRRFRFPDGLESHLLTFFTSALTQMDAAVLVAGQGERLVGYAYVARSEPSFVDALPATTWLHDLYVDPAARGAGVGAALLRSAHGARRAFGTPSLHLTVAPTNTAARRLFEAAGFRPTMIEMQVDSADSDGVTMI